MLKFYPTLKIQPVRLLRHASTATYNSSLMTLKKDLKQAMIAKNELKKTTIRGLLSAIKNREIDSKGKDFDVFMLFDTYSKLVNQRKDSIKGFIENGREDLVAKETEEMEIIKKYMSALPVASKEEIEAKASEYLQSLKATESTLQMKQIFNNIDWETISLEWKASPNVIKSCLAAQFKRIFQD